MKATYLPKDAAVRHMHQLLKATQGKLTISEFAQKLEYHWLSLPDMALVSEGSIVNVFMHGLNPRLPRLEIFRRMPENMVDAVNITLGEHYSQSAASFSGHHDKYDMEISQIGTTNNHREHRQFDRNRLNPHQGRTVRCYNCQRMGHISRNCTAPRRPASNAHRTGRPTGRTDQWVPHTAPAVPVDLAPGTLCRLGEHHQMLSYLLPIAGFRDPLRVLIDSGASENYARRATIARVPDVSTSVARPNDTLRIRLADGRIISNPRQTVALQISIGDFSSTEEFFLMDLDNRWDLILGMGWLERHQPIIDWRLKTMAPPSPRSHVSDLAQSNELAMVSVDSSSTRPCGDPVDCPRQEQVAPAIEEPSNEPEGLAAHVRFSADGNSDDHDKASIDANQLEASETTPVEQERPDSVSVEEFIRSTCDLDELSTRADEIVALPEMSFRSFSRLLHAQEPLSIAVICVEEDGTLHTTSTMDKDVLDDADKQA
ncbi:hypothetical protein AC1031_008539 [Aphanomyces cochlioides]|nr:hypothetical protein AC1031_008539 [Aphanomyces cochlioides]